MDVNEIRRVKSELRILHLQIARLKLPVMVWMLPLRLSKPLLSVLICYHCQCAYQNH